MSTKLVSPTAVVLLPAARDPAPRRRSPRIHRRRVRSPGRRAGVVAFDARLLVAPHRDRRPRKLSLPVVQQPNLTFPLTRGSPFVALTFPDALTPRGHTGRSTTCGRAVTFQATSTATARDGAGGLRCHLSELRRTNRSQSRAGAAQYRHSLSVDSVEEASSRLKGRSSNDPSDPVEASSGLVNPRTSSAAISLPAHIDCISDVDDDTAHSSPRDDPRDTKPEKKRNKLTRRKACYRQKKDGRSRSLTHIDTLDPAMLVRQDDTDRLSEPDTTATSSRHPHRESVRRRHLSMQTKIGSSDRFSVSFDLMGRSIEIPVEHIPASRGTVLREALSAACECNRVDMDAISVYLENGRTPLPLLTTETYWLGGKHLRVKARDQDSKSPVRSQSTSCQNLTPVRKSSGSYRGMVNKLMSSSAEEPCSAAPGDASGGSAGAAVSGSNDGSLKVAKSSVTKQRWSGIFGSSFVKESGSSKMDLMIGCLDTYSRHGIPRLPHLINFDGDAREEEELYNLEADWRDLVSGPENLSERCHQQQNAIWELVHTEAAYIHTLKVITDLFLSCLCNLQNCQILSEVDTQQLFCNIQEIYAASRHFWHEHVLRMLTKSRQSRLPLNITDMYDGFCQFEEIFHPYTRYCLDQSNSKAYCKTLSRNNGLFNGYLAWCETQKDCNRLRLVDILAKPWQRITKYSLLLKAVLKKTDQPEEQRTIREMIHNVDVFVGSVDGSLRNRHEQDRVSGIMERIDAYDCVDTKDDELERMVRLHLSLDLNSDMPGCGSGHRRNLLMEGELKLRDNTYSKVDVRCFLFTDMLLVCKPLTKKGDRLRVIRPPYVVDRLLVQESVKDVALLCVYLNEYQAASAAFTLICSDSRQVKLWLEWLKKAQDRYREARMDTMSQEYVFFDDEDELEMPTQALLTSSARSPRGGSSRSSRVPSLIHSHSSSVDNGELTARLSVGDDVRATSEETAALNTKHRISLSPRRERRPVLRSVGSTPNQLSVTTQLSCGGQSMPDLTAPTTPAALTCARPLSPSQRGVTYPPPSPRGLRRAVAAPPTPPLRNPPLTRARHVGSPSPPPGQQTAPTSAPEAPPVSVSDRITPTDVNEDVFVGAAEDADPDQDGKCRRHVRDRLENRRYHTAGVIEDMKRQELRNPGIHKRLSWNCGHQQLPSSSVSSLARHNQPPRAVRHSNKCLSSDSMHSSSGVSSVNSLHFSTGSEMEEPLLTDSLAEMIAYEMDEGRELDDAADEEVGDQSPSRLISSHVSTTYISVDGASSSGVSCISSSVQKTQGGVKIDISDSPTTAAADPTSLSRVQITVNDDPTANNGAAVRTTGGSTLASDV